MQRMLDPNVTSKPILIIVLRAWLGQMHRFVIKEFHHIAVIVEFEEAVRNGELETLSKIVIVVLAEAADPERESFPRFQDPLSFWLFFIATFMMGCFFAWNCARIRAYFVKVVSAKALNPLTFLLNTFFTIMTSAMALARPSDGSRWILALGFGWCLAFNLWRASHKIGAEDERCTHTPDFQAIGNIRLSTLDTDAQRDKWEVY